MSNYVAWLLEATINDRALLDTVMKELSDNVAANEPGTTHYEWGVNPDGKMLSYERFTDSAAALAHLGGFGPTAERFMKAVAPSRLVVFGNPSDELKAAIADWQPEYVTEVSAFSR
jgi:quinol monooxygenase YgiN